MIDTIFVCGQHFIAVWKILLGCGFILDIVLVPRVETQVILFFDLTTVLIVCHDVSIVNLQLQLTSWSQANLSSWKWESQCQWLHSDAFCDNIANYTVEIMLHICLYASHTRNGKSNRITFPQRYIWMLSECSPKLPDLSQKYMKLNIVKWSKQFNKNSYMKLYTRNNCYWFSFKY